MNYLEVVGLDVLLQEVRQVNNFLLVVLHHQALEFPQEVAIIVDKVVRGEDSFKEIAIHSLLD